MDLLISPTAYFVKNECLYIYMYSDRFILNFFRRILSVFLIEAYVITLCLCSHIYIFLNRFILIFSSKKFINILHRNVCNNNIMPLWRELSKENSARYKNPINTGLPIFRTAEFVVLLKCLNITKVILWRQCSPRNAAFTGFVLCNSHNRQRLFTLK